MSEHNSLGHRIAEARATKRLSLEQMAQKAGITAETLGDWEAGAAEPRPNKMQMLAGVLGVSMSWLLTGEGEHGPHDDAHARLERLEQKVERMAQLQAELTRLSAEIAEDVSSMRAQEPGHADLAA